MRSDSWPMRLPPLRAVSQDFQKETIVAREFFGSANFRRAQPSVNVDRDDVPWMIGPLPPKCCWLASAASEIPRRQLNRNENVEVVQDEQRLTR